MRRITTLYRASALTVCVVGTALAFGCGGGNNNSLGGPAPGNGRASTTIWTDNAVIGTNQSQPVYRIGTVNNADGSVVTYYGTHDANGLPNRLVVSAHNVLIDPNNPNSGFDPTRVTRTVYDLQNRPIQNVGTANLPAINYTWTSPNQVQVGLIDANNTTLVLSTLTGNDGVHYTVNRTKAAVLPSAAAKNITRATPSNLAPIFNAFVALLTQEVNNTNLTLVPAVQASRLGSSGTTDTVDFGGTSYLGGGLLLSLFEKGNPSLTDITLLGQLPAGALQLSTFVHDAVGVTSSTHVAALATVKNPNNPVYGRNFNANNPGLGGTGSVGITE